MTLSLSSAAATAQADSLMAQIDAGSGPGTLTVYTGDKPATADDSPTGTLLVTFTLTDPDAAAAVAGVAAWDTGGGIDAVTVDAGTGGWFRVSDSDGNPVFDGVVGDDLLFDAATWLSGETVTLGSGSTIQPTE